MTIQKTNFGAILKPNSDFSKNDAFISALQRCQDEKAALDTDIITIARLNAAIKDICKEKKVAEISAADMFLHGFLWEIRLTWNEKEQAVERKEKRNSITKSHFRSVYEENYGLQWQSFQKSLYIAGKKIQEWELLRNKDTEKAALQALKDCERFILNCIDRNKPAVTCNIADLHYIAALTKRQEKDGDLGNESRVTQSAGKPLQRAIESVIFMRLHSLKIPKLQMSTKDTIKYNKILQKEKEEKQAADEKAAIARASQLREKKSA